MEIKTNNSSYKDRNKNKISTLIGNDPVFLDILSLEFERDGVKYKLGELLDKTFENKSRLEEVNTALKEENDKLNAKITELKNALKEYITTENIVDSANTDSIEILSKELAKVNLKLDELTELTKYL